MKGSLKKILPVILLVWPYIFFLLSRVKNETAGTILFWAYLILTIVVYVSNIANACMYKGEDAYYTLARWNMVIKLGHVPFYLLVFAVGVVFLMASVVPALMFVTPVVIFYLVMIDLFLMITSSVYGISALLQAKHRGEISLKYLIGHGILHFVFVGDVISGIMVFWRLRRQKRDERG